MHCVQSMRPNNCSATTYKTRCRPNVTRLARRAVSTLTRPAAGPPTVHPPGGRLVHPPAALQTTTDDNDRRPRAKQYWPIKRTSNNIIPNTGGGSGNQEIALYHAKKAINEIYN